MKVLSLFDGMSCGQIALSKLGIKVDKYYASEIDKYAIQITQKNFPDTIQLGDVCQLDDPRSALFFEFIRLLKEIGPKYFLLENVRMKKEFLEVITDQVSSCYTADDVDDEYVDMFGNVRFEPHFINSSLLSAQSRKRYYWTNIPNIKQPKDKGIVLRDILETEPKSITKMSDKFVKRNGDKNCMIDQNREKAHNLSAEEYVKNGRQGNYLACDDEGKPVYKPVKKTERNRKHLRQPNEKSLCMTATMYKGAGNNGMTLVPQKPKQVGIAVDVNGHDILKRVYSPEGKSPTINTMGGGNREPKVVTGGAMRARSKNKDGKHVEWKETKPQQMLELRKDEKSNSISTVSKDSLVVEDEMHWRKLTPLECERLQTVPDGYTEGVSNTQRYRMLGNGWTVDVIAHIYKNMEK